MRTPEPASAAATDPPAPFGHAALDQLRQSETAARLLRRHLKALRRRGGYKLCEARVRDIVAGRRGKWLVTIDVRARDRISREMTDRLLTAHCFAADDGLKVYRRVRGRHLVSDEPPNGRGFLAYLAAERLLLHEYRFDYRLSALRDATDPAAMAALLAERLPGQPRVRACAVEPVRYVPEKRCQLRYLLNGPGDETRTVFGKVYSNGHGRRVFAAMQGLARTAFPPSDPEVATPAPLAHVESLHLLVQEAVPGATLHDLILQGRADADLFARAGICLARLHRASIQLDAAFGLDDEIGLIGELMRKESVTLDGAESLFRDIRRAAPAHRSSVPVVSHRDFYDKQLIIDGRRTFVIDFDTICHAPPEIDVGNFVAHVRLRMLQGRLSPELASRGERRFLDAYLAAVPAGAVRTDAIGWSVATALFRLAHKYARRPGWESLPRPVLEECRQYLRRS